jgi:hypothetical protein
LIWRMIPKRLPCYALPGNTILHRGLIKFNIMRKHLNHLCFALICVAAFLPPAHTSAQARIRKLSTIINHPSLNLYAPYISADANALIFLSDNAEDHALTAFYSFREKADWQEPQVLPKNVNTRLNFLRGFALSADGNTLYFSTMKSPGVGGFDICSSEWKGSAWSNPVNLAAPINSRGHEACPSLTPEGNTMYFMRCLKMDQNAADQCTLYRVVKKSNGQWDEPVALPDIINTGNSQSPRIMADGETLIFSSDKMKNGKGGMDLYTSKMVNGNWTNPVGLDFVNTEKDDQYVSVAALGRYILRDAPGTRKSELVEYLIPENLRPKGMMKLEGKVSDPNGSPLPAYVSIIDLQSGKRTYNGRPNNDGSFLIYVMEGSRYELSVDPEHADQSYFSKTLDLTTNNIPQVEKVNAVLKPLASGDELSLDGIRFKEGSAEIDMASSEGELKRFVRLVTGNPGLKFEIPVLLQGYQEDSIQSNPDLTELMYDSVPSKYIDIDTLGQLFEKDTISVKVIYHNDRTVEESQSIIEYLIARGADRGNLSVVVNASPAAPEDKKTLVKARIN